MHAEPLRIPSGTPAEPPRNPRGAPSGTPSGTLNTYATSVPETNVFCVAADYVMLVV